MKPLKRHPDLIERSREHHHSLALCLRILREPAADHQADIENHRADLLAHFASEEAQFAPHWGRLDAALQQRFEEDHAALRGMLASVFISSPMVKPGAPMACTTPLTISPSCFS